jgi:hypothetical protein
VPYSNYTIGAATICYSVKLGECILRGGGRLCFSHYTLGAYVIRHVFKVIFNSKSRIKKIHIFLLNWSSSKDAENSSIDTIFHPPQLSRDSASALGPFNSTKENTDWSINSCDMCWPFYLLFILCII